MNTLPKELDKTYWEGRHRCDLAGLAELTGKAPAEIQVDLPTPDAHARAENLAANQLHDRVVELEVKRIEQAREGGAGCDHDADTDGTKAEHLKILNNGRRRGEIYRCECGALIDYGHTDNYEPPFRAMTAEEITRAVREAANRAKQA